MSFLGVGKESHNRNIQIASLQFRQIKLISRFFCGVVAWRVEISTQVDVRVKGERLVVEGTRPQRIYRRLRLRVGG
ncbi:MAG: hypothetical protein U0V64_14425 [Cyclobacteriaceae bacterium]